MPYRPPFYWFYERVEELKKNRKIKNPRKLAAWEWYHKLTNKERAEAMKKDRKRQKKHGKRKSAVRSHKSKRMSACNKGRLSGPVQSLQPFYIGGRMSKKKHHKKRGYSVTHHVSRRMSGDFVGIEGAGRTAMNTLGTILLALFGAGVSSFIANKIPATVPGSKHLRYLTPAALGLAGQYMVPRNFRATLFPAAVGAYAVSGVTAVKTFLPGVPLLAGDVNALEVPQYTLGTDGQGRLIDTRDGSLLLDEKGRTLKGDGTPHDENALQIEGMDGAGPGDMLGTEPGSMLGAEPGDMLGDDEDFS